MVNLVTPGNGEKYAIEMSNSTLTNIEGVQAKKPDLTITVNRRDLVMVMMGVKRFDDLIAEGKARFDGDRRPYEQLKAILMDFDPLFELMPGTASPQPAKASGRDPFEQPQPASSAGG